MWIGERSCPGWHRGEGSGENPHATLIHKTIYPYVRAEEGTRPGRTRKKPKDLSAREGLADDFITAE